MGDAPLAGLRVVGLAQQGELDHLRHLPAGQLHRATAIVGMGVHHIEVEVQLAQHGQKVHLQETGTGQGRQHVEFDDSDAKAAQQRVGAGQQRVVLRPLDIHLQQQGAGFRVVAGAHPAIEAEGVAPIEGAQPAAAEGVHALQQRQLAGLHRGITQIGRNAEALRQLGFKGGLRGHPRRKAGLNPRQQVGQQVGPITRTANADELRPAADGHQQLDRGADVLIGGGMVPLAKGEQAIDGPLPLQKKRSGQAHLQRNGPIHRSRGSLW